MDRVMISEHRLQRSIDRLNALDTRASALLGFTAVMIAGLATFFFRANHPVALKAAAAFLLFVISMGCAGISLMFNVQYDSPDVTCFQSAETGDDFVDPLYFRMVGDAVDGNNLVAQKKTLWLMAAFLALVAGTVAMIA